MKHILLVDSPLGAKKVDPAMARLLIAVDKYLKNGGTMQKLGELAGYETLSARQSVHQFLRSTDPRVSVVRRFAVALGMSIREVFNPNAE